MELKRVGVWSVAKISGALYAGIGLIIGAIFALISLLGAGLGAGLAGEGQGGAPAFLGALFGVGAIIFLPIFYGLIGLVGGAISGGLYNLFARLVGGIELQLE